MKVALAWSISIATGSAAIFLMASDTARAIRDSQRARADLARTVPLAAELIALRASRPAPVAAAIGLQPRIASVLNSCNLPAATLHSFAPEADTPRRGQSDGPHRRRATLVLHGLTLPGFGRFLAAWREAEPGWVIATLDLTQASARSTPAGGDLPLRAALVLEHLSTAEPAPVRNANAGTHR